jgi:HSP20 family protein
MVALIDASVKRYPLILQKGAGRFLVTHNTMAIQSLIPWRREPRELARSNDPFAYLRQRLDRLFDDPFLLSGRWFEEPHLFPQVDVSESDKEIVVGAELPGLDSKDIDVNVSAEAVTLSGEKKTEQKSGNGGRRWSERTYGRFERSIPLPTEVQGDKAKAEFKNGVLKVILPKAENAKSRTHKIAIES